MQLLLVFTFPHFIANVYMLRPNWPSSSVQIGFYSACLYKGTATALVFIQLVVCSYQRVHFYCLFCLNFFLFRYAAVIDVFMLSTNTMADHEAEKPDSATRTHP
jgi:hypothetical protein